MAEYSHPEVLVSTDWVADHLEDPNIKIVESDEDVLLYEVGHIPEAIKVDWQNDLQDPIIRDYVNKENFEELMSEKGIANDTTAAARRRALRPRVGAGARCRGQAATRSGTRRSGAR